MKCASLLAAAVIVLVAHVGQAADDPPSYAKDIKPFLTKYCIECHQGNKPKAGVNVSTYDGLTKMAKKGIPVVPNKSDKSLLVSCLEGKGAKKMPPAKYDVHPTAKEITMVKAWIDAGAKDDSKTSMLAPSGERELLLALFERAVAVLPRREFLCGE